MSQQKWLALEARLDTLIREHQRLRQVVATLEEERQQEQAAWQRERQEWAARHEQARERLDYVIAQLREFEQAG